MISSESSTSSLIETEKRSYWKYGAVVVILLTGILVVEVSNVIGTFELAEAVQNFKNSLIPHF